MDNTLGATTIGAGGFCGTALLIEVFGTYFEEMAQM